MKIRLPVHAMRKAGYVVLKETNKPGAELINRIFAKKQEWEERNGREFYLQIELELRRQKRTFKQNSTVWKLVECIWASMEKDPPTEEEKYSLYLDLLEAYADKTKNRITGELRPVHISESNSLEGAHFIDNLLYHLATMCNLDYGAQSQVIDVLQDWESWRGSLEIDPMDYSDTECTRLLTEAEWREKHSVSEASGQGGGIVRAHIVSRGSDAPDIEKAWNWIALLHEEHTQQHQIGWDAFLRIYPHLLGRVGRARNLAGKPELDFKKARKAVQYNPESLAMQALGG
ncbi:MAG: hypothetical protein LBR99_01325 [Treponema sp.]|jgi:hypothetical protein|nr:hypothetical protein [Treponema sp.]